MRAVARSTGPEIGSGTGRDDARLKASGLPDGTGVAVSAEPTIIDRYVGFCALFGASSGAGGGASWAIAGAGPAARASFSFSATNAGEVLFGDRWHDDSWFAGRPRASAELARSEAGRRVCSEGTAPT